MLRDDPFEITLADQLKQLFAAFLDVIHEQQLRARTGRLGAGTVQGGIRASKLDTLRRKCIFYSVQFLVRRVHSGQLDRLMKGSP